jgi:uncharacterized protein YndB with AHSA1/START domain
MDNNPIKITIKTCVNATPEELWKYMIESEHIMKWNHASDDWHTVSAVNDFKVGGKFDYRMEAKDGSSGFDFIGVYDDIETFKSYSYTLGDNRRVEVKLTNIDDKTEVTYIFDAEHTFPLEHQKSGWQAILDNFKKYVENIL